MISYGVIPIVKDNEGWKILLVQHVNGHWSFPKGRPEPDEAPFETAVRELFEETGLAVDQWVEDQSFTEHYSFHHNGKRIKKTVKYFLASVKGDVKIQDEELCDFCFVTLEEAKKKVTFDEARSILKQLHLP
ncbi:MAG: NUDIX domain-containing protein [Waddliaceae bacterium]